MRIGRFMSALFLLTYVFLLIYRFFFPRFLTSRSFIFPFSLYRFAPISPTSVVIDDMNFIGAEFYEVIDNPDNWFCVVPLWIGNYRWIAIRGFGYFIPLFPTQHRLTVPRVAVQVGPDTVRLCDRQSGQSRIIPRAEYTACAVRCQDSASPALFNDIERYVRRVIEPPMDAQHSVDPDYAKNVFMTAALLYSKFCPSIPKVFNGAYFSHTAILGGQELDADLHNISAVADLPAPTPQKVQAASTASNLAVGAKLRHADVALNKRVPASYLGYLEEFKGFMRRDAQIAVGHSFSPAEPSEVVEALCKPAQKKRMLAYLLGPIPAIFPKICGMFTKSNDLVEAGSAPRMIYPQEQAYLVETYARVLRFKKEVLTHMHWYYPCLTPPQIAARMNNFVQPFRRVVVTDLSKFDGTLSKHIREAIEVDIYEEFVPGSGELFKQEFDFTAYGKGLKHNLDGSRPSGSAITTDGNSILEGFLDYVALRVSGLSPDEAWASIGPHCGDDGVQSAPVEIIIAVHEAVGLKIKCREVEHGGWIDFLGRIFPDAWSSGSSFQDCARVWAKLVTRTHPTSTLPITLAERLNAYLITDGRTPVLSAWCRRCLKLFYPGYRMSSYFSGWFEHNASDLSASNTWPQDDVEAIGRLEAEFLMLDNPEAFIAAINRADESKMARLNFGTAAWDLADMLPDSVRVAGRLEVPLIPIVVESPRPDSIPAGKHQGPKKSGKPFVSPDGVPMSRSDIISASLEQRGPKALVDAGAAGPTSVSSSDATPALNSRVFSKKTGSRDRKPRGVPDKVDSVE
jgi:hypothetical protein